MPSKRFRTLPAAGSVAESLRVSDILGFPAFSGAEVVAGKSAMTSAVDHVNVMQIPTDRFAKANELLLASENALSGIEARELVSALAAKGVAALAVRSPDLQKVLGKEALSAAEKAGMGVIALPDTTHLSDAQTTVLEHLISKRADELKAAADVREALSASALSGGGLTALVRTIASLIESPVWILDEDAQVMAASQDESPLPFAHLLQAYASDEISKPIASDDGFVLAPISVPYRRLGCLVCALTAPLDNGELAAVEHGATIAALQIGHLQGADEATMRFRSGFIRDLLSGTLDAASAGRRAASVGWSPKTSYRILLLKPGEQRARLPAVLAAQLPDALITNHAGVLLLMIPDSASSTADRFIRELASTDDGVRVGVSATHHVLGEVRSALEEAEEALRASETFDRSAQVREFDGLGPLRFLSAVPTEELQRFVDNTLRPLNELDEEYRTALEDTLRHLIAANLNVAQAARDGGWHYNTLRYRIERLTDLLGPFMEDGTTLDSIALALFLREEVAAS